MALRNAPPIADRFAELKAEVAKHRAAIHGAGGDPRHERRIRLDEMARLRARAEEEDIELAELEAAQARLRVLGNELRQLDVQQPLEERVAAIHRRDLEAAESALHGAAAAAYDETTGPRYRRVAELLEQALSEVEAIEQARREVAAAAGHVPHDVRHGLGNLLLEALSLASRDRHGHGGNSASLLGQLRRAG